jgi:hypothetical protein
MQFQNGDRVLMRKHADWKNEAVGTITSVRPSKPVTLPDGTTDCWYWIEFDESQRDYTDEMHGKDLQYKTSTVLGRFFCPLQEART